MHSDFVMQRRETNPNFMNGVPELVILRLLQKEEMYGYEIVHAIRERSGSAITAGEGVVYPVLHGLERDGALKSRRKAVNGRSRIYYSITASGSLLLADRSEAWTSLAAAIQNLLTGSPHAKALG
jgi:PadR family transcriptional regulator PadR